MSHYDQSGRKSCNRRWWILTAVASIGVATFILGLEKDLIRRPATAAANCGEPDGCPAHHNSTVVLRPSIEEKENKKLLPSPSYYYRCNPGRYDRMTSESMVELQTGAELVLHRELSARCPGTYVPAFPALSLSTGICNGSTHNERMATVAREMKRLGQMGLPCLIVSNHFLMGWGREAHAAMPHCTVAGWIDQTPWKIGEVDAGLFWNARQYVPLPYVENQFSRRWARIGLERTSLLYFRGSDSGRGWGPIIPNIPYDARKQLQKLSSIDFVAARDDFGCDRALHFALLTDLRVWTSGGQMASTSGSKSQMALEMAKSKFCFVIRGDSPSSSRLFDAMAAGCVPIIVGAFASIGRDKKCTANSRRKCYPWNSSKRDRKVDIRTFDDLPFSDRLDYSQFVLRIATEDWMRSAESATAAILSVLPTPKKYHEMKEAMDNQAGKVLYGSRSSLIGEWLAADAGCPGNSSDWKVMDSTGLALPIIDPTDVWDEPPEHSDDAKMVDVLPGHNTMILMSDTHSRDDSNVGPSYLINSHYAARHGYQMKFVRFRCPPAVADAGNCSTPCAHPVHGPRELSWCKLLAVNRTLHEHPEVDRVIYLDSRAFVHDHGVGLDIVFNQTMVTDLALLWNRPWERWYAVSPSGVQVWRNSQNSRRMINEWWDLPGYNAIQPIEQLILHDTNYLRRYADNIAVLEMTPFPDASLPTVQEPTAMAKIPKKLQIMYVSGCQLFAYTAHIQDEERESIMMSFLQELGMGEIDQIMGGITNCSLVTLQQDG